MNYENAAIRKIDVSERIDTKTIASKNVCVVTIGTLKTLDLNSNRMFVTNVTMD